MIYELINVLKLVLYAWSAIEVGLLAHLYYYASREMKSRVIRGLFFLLLSFGIVFIFRGLFVYSIKLDPDLHYFFSQFVALPLILVIVAARHFRKVSLERPESVDEDIKKVCKPKK